MRDSVVFRSAFFQNLRSFVSPPTQDTSQLEDTPQLDEFEEVEPELIINAFKDSPPDPSNYIIQVGDTSKKIETF